jgi:hypothetical protein
MKPIPVIGIPVVTNPFWVSRLLTSIDYPVDKVIIINNNGREEIDDELDRLKQMTHPFVKKIKVCHLPGNIGCAGAWNLIIKSTILSPYWIIANDDVAFCGGLLKEFSDRIEEDKDLGMIHPNSGDFSLGSWDLFLIRDIIIRDFGLFDENTYPAYCEDVDYLMRFQHRPIKKIVGLEGKYLHGLEDSTQYYSSGSQTLNSTPKMSEKLKLVNAMNIEYLNEKWGSGWRYVSPTSEPFPGQEKMISSSKYDLDFIRSKHLGF